LLAVVGFGYNLDTVLAGEHGFKAFSDEAAVKERVLPT
jgi:hypothetical protein